MKYNNHISPPRENSLENLCSEVFKSNLKRTYKKLQTYLSSQRSTLLHLPHQPYTFQSQAPSASSKIISRKTPLTAVIAIIRAYPSAVQRFKYVHAIFNRSLSLSLDECCLPCQHREIPIDFPSQTPDLFRDYFAPTLSGKCEFTGNTSFVAFVCVCMRAPASSLFLSLSVPAKKKASFISAGKTQNDDEKLMKGMSERVELDCELY